MSEVLKRPAMDAPALKSDSKDVLFEVPIEGRLPWGRHVFLSVQNMLVMAGLFLFPGIFGITYHLRPSEVAVLYGAAFIMVGIGTLLQGLLGLRLPIVIGPWSATFAGLLAMGNIYGLGTAFGSLTVAAAIVAALSVPVRGFTVTQFLAKSFNSGSSDVSGGRFNRTG